MKQIVIELQLDKPFDQQIESVVAAWKTGEYRSLLVHIYSGLTDGSASVSAACEIERSLPDALVVGTMSGGEICDGELMSPGILLSAILTETSTINMFRYDGVLDNESHVGSALREDVEGVEDAKALELIFPGTSMNTRELFHELSQCRRDLQIFGGYSGGHELNSEQRFLFDAQGMHPDALVAIVYAGADLHVNMDKVAGWDPLGIPYTVTKAQGHRLIELNGRPAAEAYERFLHIDRTRNDNAQAGFESPLISVHNGDECLRSVIHICKDGSVEMHGLALEESQIYMSYGNPGHIIDRVNKRLEVMCAFRPQVILLFSCLVRKQFWLERANLETMPFAQLASTSGFYTWGEVLRSPATGEVVEHNVTLLSIGFREGDIPKGAATRIRVDDSALQKDASLLARLASFVDASMRELETAHNDLLVLNKRLTVMAERDALTGLYNRGKTELIINEALDEGAVTGQPTSLIMLDVDHFKHINDSFGHDTGDAVLKEIAELLCRAAQQFENAEAGRWGGEEFFLVFPRVDECEALKVAEELRMRVEHHPFSEVGRLTISLGVITAQGVVDRRTLFTRVDDALYQAKGLGRNRVVPA